MLVEEAVIVAESELVLVADCVDVAVPVATAIEKIEGLGRDGIGTSDDLVFLRHQNLHFTTNTPDVNVRVLEAGDVEVAVRESVLVRDHVAVAVLDAAVSRG